MDFRESLYKMSLAGALGGLMSWAAEPWVLAVAGLETVQQEQYWIVQYIDLFLVALFISACSIGFVDYWSNRRRSFFRVALGALASCSTVLLAEAGLHSLRSKWLGELRPLTSLILAWAVTGASVGLVVGFIRYRLLLRRVLLSFVGGAAGATVGAWGAFSLGEVLPYLSHALGLMITGCGVAFGSTAAVILFRKAQIRFAGSEDEQVSDYFMGRSQVWELHRGDEYLIGRAPKPSNIKQYIHIPDREMASLHAEVYEEAGNFFLRAHRSNRGAGESEYPLSVKRMEEPDDRDVVEAVKLETGSEIGMGRTRFLFSFRGKDGFHSLVLNALVLGSLLLFAGAPAHAQSERQLQEVRFAPADKIRLYQCTPGSERPCFRVTVNLVDKKNNVVPIPVLNPQSSKEQTQVFEDESELQVVCVGQDFREGKPRRVAILLVDTSGSMLGSTVPGLKTEEAIRLGKTKFDVLKAAALHFARDLEEGIDEIALIPFASRNVAKGVDEATFCVEQQCLEDRLKNLSYPQPGARTGLFTAVQAAISRLQKIRTEAKEKGGTNPQCLLVVMTDGINFVGGRNDDSNLLTDWKPVRTLATTASLPIITVGFGDSHQIDEGVLKNLAWPSLDNYLPARDPGELVNAFQKARALQLQRLQITFLPQQNLRGQLVKPHEYQVRFRMDQQHVIEGQFSWSPEVGVPPFEGVLASDTECKLPADELMASWFLTYFGTIAVLGILLYMLWFKVPFLLWAEQHDLQVLRSRALSIQGQRREGR